MTINEIEIIGQKIKILIAAFKKYPTQPICEQYLEEKFSKLLGNDFDCVLKLMLKSGILSMQISDDLVLYRLKL